MQRRVTHREHTHTHTHKTTAVPCHAMPRPLLSYAIYYTENLAQRARGATLPLKRAWRSDTKVPSHASLLTHHLCMVQTVSHATFCESPQAVQSSHPFLSIIVNACARNAKFFFFQCARHATCVCIHCRYATRGCKCFIASMNREAKGRVV